MRTSFGCVILALLGLFAGCNSSQLSESELVVRVGPHQGTIVQLPEEKGLVELVNEPEARDRRSTEPTAVVAYFLRTGGATPLEPAPSDVSVVIEDGKKASQTVPLNHDPKSDDAAGSARFISKPGKYQLAGLKGTLNATIGGQQVSAPFSGGR